MPTGERSGARGKQQLVHAIVGLNADLARLMATSNADAWMDLQNITVKQLKVLLILSQRGSETVSALAKRLNVHISTVTGILDRLVEHGLVRREEDPEDRRHVISRLTPQGEETLNRLYYGAGQRELAQRLEQLDAEQLGALEQSLRALVSAW